MHTKIFTMKTVALSFLATFELTTVAGCSAAGNGDKVRPSRDSQFIEANVSGSFPAPINPMDQCEPYGMPITFFLTGAFGLDSLVEETATLVSDRCLLAQTLAAPASAWATLAYNTVCLGGGDTRLCNTIATRRCSVDLMMQWSKERSEPVSTEEPTFGFRIDVPSLDDTSRVALRHRAEQEAKTLLDETRLVMRDRSAGTRKCEDEGL